MKQCHKWDSYEVIEAKCPYCRKWIEEIYCFPFEGKLITCYRCNRGFKLGKQT